MSQGSAIEHIIEQGEKDMSQRIVKSGDAQQYEAEPHHLENPNVGVTPEVRLLWMTPDPLGAVASFNAMYSGRVIRDLNDVTNEDRYQALVDVQQTHLQAPLESIKLHFLIEGVDRAFTHQLVRQRTAVYAQESLRFAVLGDLIDATTLPPSLQGTERADPQKDWIPDTERQRWREIWDMAIRQVDRAYHRLVEAGMPSEEARGLLPHATATRIHFVTDLRNLKDHAGNRLCTQAQFHWRQVFSQMVGEVGNYANSRVGGLDDAWQFQALAESALFRPVCYQIGRCPFQASFDRACTIRDRVEMNAECGRPSSEWHKKSDPAVDRIHVAAISPAEWMLDSTAARVL